MLAAAALVWAGRGHAAHADGLDGERFAPAVGAEGGFVNEHPTVPFHLGWSIGMFVNVADDPVVQVDANGKILGKPVDTAGTADVVASLGLWNRVELGIGLPVHVVYDGDPYGALKADAGVGDLRFVPKIAIIRTGSLENHFELGIALPVSFPTGNDDAFRGAGGFTLGGELLLAAHVGRVGFGADAGYRYRTQHPGGLPWGDSVAFGPWLSVGLVDKLSLRVDGILEKFVSTPVTASTFPVEVLGGLEYRLGKVALYGGASAGLSEGVGDPDFRIIFGVRFRQDAPEHQGFDDIDRDGVMDKDDGAPYAAEDGDGFEDEDGVPDPDNDGDGIPDEDDECPDLKGEADRRGCPARTFVKIEEGRIFIIGKVQFETGSAQITTKSAPLLDQIAQALNTNTQVKRVRIEGFTDNTGDAGVNLKLSEQRAGSVRAALEHRGVDSRRLETKGYGEMRPIAPNRSPGGRQKNRRVEFVISESGT
jgi:outer membrane protein OmpA-like peptidoglycan-associated protein